MMDTTTTVQVTLAGPGVCTRCGCTDAWACAGGCYWVNVEHTLCSACATLEQRAERLDVDIEESGHTCDDPEVFHDCGACRAQAAEARKDQDKATQ